MGTCCHLHEELQIIGRYTNGLVLLLLFCLAPQNMSALRSKHWYISQCPCAAEFRVVAQRICRAFPMLVIVCDDLLCFFVQYVPSYIGGLWLLYIFRFHRFLFFSFFMHAFSRCFRQFWGAVRLRPVRLTLLLLLFSFSLPPGCLTSLAKLYKTPLNYQSTIKL